MPATGFYHTNKDFETGSSNGGAPIPTITAAFAVYLVHHGTVSPCLSSVLTTTKVLAERALFEVHAAAVSNAYRVSRGSDGMQTKRGTPMQSIYYTLFWSNTIGSHSVRGLNARGEGRDRHNLRYGKELSSKRGPAFCTDSVDAAR